MRISTFLLSILFSLTLHASERVAFNDDWRFKMNDQEGVQDQLTYDTIRTWLLPSANEFLNPEKQHPVPEGKLKARIDYANNDFDDNDWRVLNLPHDWGVEGEFKQEYPGETGKLAWWGIAWYRKTLELSPDEMRQKYFLDIDGAMSYATVWCNGQFTGGRPYGYASFRVDLTPFLSAGKNTIAIRLNNPQESARWYPGGGIYRNVWLVKASPVHVTHWGTQVTTNAVSKTSAAISVECKVQNESSETVHATVTNAIYALGKDGSISGDALLSFPKKTIALKPGFHATASAESTLDNPALWNLDNPVRYTVVTTIESNGEILDRHETAFGIRSIEFTADKGFFLNGEPVYLKGVCMHHDLGALGAAVHLRALERQLEILKEMGCNAIRTTHNPPTPELAELCDRMGILLIVEFFDMWQEAKKANDYHKYFNDWHEADVRSIIRHFRNHPSVIAWSLGNEVPEQNKDSGRTIARNLSQMIKEEDGTRPSTIGCNYVESGFEGMQQIVDLFGYNYKPHTYRKFIEHNPGKPLYGSETASCVSTRGFYVFPVSENNDACKADFQVSSYDLCATPWSQIPEIEFKDQDANPSVLGEFVWTGFDYLGEPTPYHSDSTILLNYSDPEARKAAEKELQSLGKINVPSRSSYFGIIDLAGFKKDRFYLYQARWRPDFPMAHILPHWNWENRTGQITPVHVYTSGDEAELFLNGKSLGRKKKGQYEYRLRWDDVVYEPGTLHVIAYKEGKTWAEDSMRTAGTPASIALESDHPTIRADGKDLVFVTVKLLDTKGIFVPDADNSLTFSVSDNAEILATDNGNPIDHTAFTSHTRQAFNGMALVIIRARKDQSGEIQLHVTAEGLKPSDIRVKIR